MEVMAVGEVKEASLPLPSTSTCSCSLQRQQEVPSAGCLFFFSLLLSLFTFSI